MANITVDKKPTGYLQPLYESQFGELIELCGSKMIIGRNPNCNIHIPDSNISRIHCVLKHDSRGWWITDRESMNGTYIYDVRLKPKIPTLLKDGHLIFLGPPSEVLHIFRYSDSHPSNRNFFIYRGRKICLKSNALSENENSSVKLENADAESKKSQVNESLQCTERKTAIPEIPECSSNRVNDSFNDNNQDCRINDDHNKNGEGSLSDSCSSDSSMASLESLQTRIRRKVASKQKSKLLGDGQGTSSTVSRKRKSGKDLQPENLIGLNPNIPGTSATEKPLQAYQKDENESVKKIKNIHVNAESITNSERQGHESENSESLLTESCITFDFDSNPFLKEIPQQYEVPETKAAVSASDVLHPESQKRKHNPYDKIVAFLESKLKQLEKINLTLEKSLEEASVKFITEEVRQSLNKEFRRKLEDLHCTICTELCIKTVVLNCSHSFCKYCITEWKKKKKQCPICRERITTETHVLALDHFIEKLTDLLSKEEQERRKELIESREKSKAQSRPRSRGRGRGRGRQQSRQHERSASVEFVMEMNDILADSIVAMANEDAIIAMASEESDSDSSVEGLSYYPGYGRCFNCGRRGHWANGCPLR